jgi:2-oxoglutarate dehydrogenase E2 component (dihydrolipoamide succinyltransferase)
MPIEVTIPEVGESISEVEIGEWLKQEGDDVERDENLVVIETDKATVELPAPVSGRVSKILKKSGETASVNEVIAYLESDGDQKRRGTQKTSEQAAEPPPQKVTMPSEPVQPEAKEPHETPEISRDADKQDRPPVREEEIVVAEQTRPRVQPEDESLEAEPAPETRPEQKQDQRDKTAPEPTAEAAAAERDMAAPDDNRPRRGAPPPPSAERRTEEAVPMSQLRRRIAERLVQAKQDAALLTTFNEIDMSGVIALRNKYRDSFRDKYEVKLGFMSFFVKATVEALKLIPEVNAEIRRDQIVYRNFFDIGVAVGGGKGLVVPVLRNAERLSFAEIERAIGDFARRAEENRLKPEELQGGTFTISNGGIYGSLFSTPIINPPQSGILGLHAIQDRPVVREGAVVVCPMMYVALTYDHRIVDGREAVTFLKHVKVLIEDPARILLEV